MIYIAPSILAADFSKLGEEINDVEKAGCTRLHIDVMDGIFVPNISLGLPVIKSIRKISSMFFDVHLMISDPYTYVQRFVEAGADSLTVHIEACREPEKVLQKIKSFGKKCGVALKPATPPSRIAELLPLLDFILVMSVEPGFGGQVFMPGTTDKISYLSEMKAKLGLSYDIGVDGGIYAHNIAGVVRAGANVIVAGSSVFGESNRKAAVERMLDNCKNI